MSPDKLDAFLAEQAAERRRRAVAAAREWIDRRLDPDPGAMAYRIGEGTAIMRSLLEEMGEEVES